MVSGRPIDWRIEYLLDCCRSLIGWDVDNWECWLTKAVPKARWSTWTENTTLPGLQCTPRISLKDDDDMGAAREAIKDTVDSCMISNSILASVQVDPQLDAPLKPAQ